MDQFNVLLTVSEPLWPGVHWWCPVTRRQDLEKRQMNRMKKTGAWIIKVKWEAVWKSHLEGQQEQLVQRGEEKASGEVILSLSSLRREVWASTHWGLSVSPSCATQLSHAAVLHSVLASWHMTLSAYHYLPVYVLHICQPSCFQIISMEKSRFRLFMQDAPIWESLHALFTIFKTVDYYSFSS